MKKINTGNREMTEAQRHKGTKQVDVKEKIKYRTENRMKKNNIKEDGTKGQRHKAQKKQVEVKEKGVCRISSSLPIPLPLPVFPESRSPNPEPRTPNPESRTTSIDVLQRHKRLKVNLRDFSGKARDVISILRHEGYFNGNAVEVSVVFGNDGFLRKLKKKYFGMNVSTDVVAFPQEERPQTSEHVIPAPYVIPAKAGIQTPLCRGERPFAATGFRVKHGMTTARTPNPESRTLLGDVVISLDRAKQQGKEHGHSFPDEVLYLFIHGMLHLLGFCDSPAHAAKQMLEKQNKIWDNVRHLSGMRIKMKERK